MGYVYGPVPSRRLGTSLGVDPVPPKTCNFSCIYCQLGRTTNFINKRRDFYPRDEILREIENRAEKTEPDYITFVGNGEPTLCKSLGWLIRKARREFSLPIAVITNGALLYEKEVREELSEADAVLPTLDAGCAKTFKIVNRPRKEIIFGKVLDGMVDFRDIYTGKLWMEFMAINGINDSKEELLKIRKALKSIRPDRVYVGIPIRPPAEPWVEGSGNLEEIRSILEEITEITLPEQGEFQVMSSESMEEELLGIVRRHPMRRDQIEGILRERGLSWNTMEKLIEGGRVREIKYKGKSFFVSTEIRMG